jgi:hypothetical protein
MVVPSEGWWFDLMEQDGHPRRADGDHQGHVVGNQAAGRAGFFPRVDDFESGPRPMVGAGVEFVTEPHDEDYGRVAVFFDICGNRRDLLGPI